MYWKLAFAGSQPRRRSLWTAVLIAICLVPVLLAFGLALPPAVPRQSGAAAALRMVIARFAPAFLVACAAITFLSSWGNVLPRNHEIGVWRSLGASRGFVIAAISTEAASVSLVGACLAILMSQGILTFLSLAAPAATSYTVGFQSCVGVSASIIAAAMTGSAIPCAVTLRQDVIDLLDRDQ